ncbi:ABC transporter substrate-binding protein [Spirochaeta dissipatitropha]
MKISYPGSLKKGLLTIIVFLFATGFIFAGGSSEVVSASTTSDAYPIIFQDSLGNSVELQNAPGSIISLSLFSDEVLLEMLPLDRFPAVSSLAVNPIYSNVADIAAGISPVIEFNVEQIISIYPDLVIAADWSETDKIAQLRQAGIPVFQIATPQSLEELKSSILTLGELTGEPDAAASIVDDMKNRIQLLEERIAQIDEDARVQALDYNNWGTANGADTTWDLVLNLAGIRNAVADLEAGDFGQVPLSKEILISLDPDILFLPGYIWGEENGADAFAAQVKNDPALAGMQAVQQNRLYIFPERLKGTYSQYLVDAAEEATRIAYPQLF